MDLQSENSKATKNEDPYKAQRDTMVDSQIIARGVKDTRVLQAIRKVPRHLFVPPADIDHAYMDSPLPIGESQTISQPYIVALMTELLQLKGNEKILEIGTGSGYQAAVLAEITKQVYSIEIVEKLGLRAKETLHNLGYKNIEIKIGDGYQGWKEKAPFDAIIVTAAPEITPPPLIAPPDRLISMDRRSCVRLMAEKRSVQIQPNLSRGNRLQARHASRVGAHDSGRPLGTSLPVHSRQPAWQVSPRSGASGFQPKRNNYKILPSGGKGTNRSVPCCVEFRGWFPRR